MHFVGRLAGAALLAVCCSPVAAEDRALLIGIGAYPGLTLGGVPGLLDLKGPQKDLERMQALVTEVLEYPSEGVRVLADEEASAERIVAEIESWLIEGTQAGDRVLLYYSGHGASAMVPDGSGGERMTSAIVPADATIELSQGIADHGQLILGPELGALVGRLEGREVTVIADSCYSGSITRGPSDPDYLRGMRTITPRGPLELTGTTPDRALIAESRTSVRLIDAQARDADAENVAVWSASTVAQVTWDTPGGGAFTTSFVEGLKDRRAAAEGSDEVTASQLLYYLRQAATAFCETLGGCRDGLTPELLASDSYRAATLLPYQPPAQALPTSPPEPSGPELTEIAVNLLGHVNDFDLSAEMLPGTTIGLGDEMTIAVTSAEAGQLLILDTGPDGQLRRLFPNEYSDAQNREGRVAAQRPFRLPDESYPFAFVATDPGPGTLLVLVAQSGIEGAGSLWQEPAFEPISAPTRALAAIAADLQAARLDPSPDGTNGAHGWAVVRIDYDVVP